MRLIGWTRTQSPIDIRALQFKHTGEELSLVVYCQTSTYRCLKSKIAVQFFFADIALQNMVETTLPDGLETSGRRAYR